MKKRLKISFIATSLILSIFSGCGYDNEDKNIIGDNLILTQDMTNPTIKLPKSLLGDGALAGIKSFKLDYWTTDEKGKRVKASGLVTIPDLPSQFFKLYKENKIPGLNNPNHNDFTFSIVSDQHGTIFENSKAPSKTQVTNIANDNPLIVAYSAKGLFMTVQPDFIGFGDSNQTHPYVMEKSLANATVDMIKASISFANKIGLPINGQVFLSGYSEGGYATMAAAKDIQKNHPEIHLMAVAPMAGPYALEDMAVGTLKSPIMAFPPFLADIAYSYAKTYDDVKLNDVINKPYNSMLDTLFDKKHSGLQIYLSLPNAADGDISKQATDLLFVPSYSDDLIANKQNPLRKHFAQNSLLDWTPKMPMRLYQCTNDAIIPYSMSEAAYNQFKQNGSNTVELEPINSVESNASNPLQVHANCASVAYSKVIPWFASIRIGGK